MIEVKTYGSIKNTMSFLKRLTSKKYLARLEQYGQAGVEALAKATPKDTGKTAASWRYTITVDDRKTRVTWSNDNVNDGQVIAILLQYGHGTRNGGFVEGRDYINPAMRGLFDEFANDLWREVVGHS